MFVTDSIVLISRCLDLREAFALAAEGAFESNPNAPDARHSVISRPVAGLEKEFWVFIQN